MTTIFRKMSLLSIIALAALAVRAQSIDSIFFHLYTDSLKKGVHNYINVDGKLSNGQWRPLSAKDITFTASHGVFEGNSLIIDTGFKGEKVNIKAVLKANPALWREVVIHIKKIESTEGLKTLEEVMNRPSQQRPGRRKNKKSDEL